MAAVKAGGNTECDYNKAGKGISVWKIKVPGLGRGSIRTGQKLRVTNGQREPGGVKVEK